MAMVFVFGSNLAGRHGMGAAKYAKEHFGAVYGIGKGRTGNAYAIPTKDKNLNTLTLNEIGEHIKMFVEYAQMHPEDFFLLTPVGTGLAGHSKKDIARLLRQHKLTPNIVLTNSWL